MAPKTITIDGNEAAARVAYQLSEIIAIYPITPSSGMGEQSDVWAAKGQKNLWGVVPEVTAMQSEGGAAGTVHGALTTGALTTTFTASQGLLLMLPNMYKIAGELTSTVFHVAARSLAAQALSIFGDHSDVMSARSTGFGMMASGSVQEVMDLATITHAASLQSRIPFLHFFDGFRTSHELKKIQEVDSDMIRQVVRDEDVLAHRQRGLSPDRPVIRGTAQNPDVFFQARETVNPFYANCPQIVQGAMDRFAKTCGRQYKLFDYVGHPQAERIIVMMGSGAEAASECVDHLMNLGEKVGLIKIRLYRPFSADHLLEAIPATVKSIAALDRTKEPGSIGEPLYQDVVTAVAHAYGTGQLKTDAMPKIIGGRYGLSSKEFTPAMVKTIFDELKSKNPKSPFTIGIHDDVSHTSLESGSLDTEHPETVRAVFIGLGSDGTVSANKNSIKIIGENTDLDVQGFFVYDSKKAGAVTVSHLRFSKGTIRSTYLIDRAHFVACHQWNFLNRIDILRYADVGATVLLNSPYGADRVWSELPNEVQAEIIRKKLSLWVIDAYEVAQNAKMGRRINTVMQTCFFAISNVIDKDQALEAIRAAVKKTYGGRGEEVVRRNFAAIDNTLENLHKVSIPKEASSTQHMCATISEDAPQFVREVTAEIMAGRGDQLPVSAMPIDGTYPTATTQWEKRSLALEIPVWDDQLCIQCGKCVLVCPHAAIRSKVFDPKEASCAPATFKHVDYRGKEHKGLRYSLQTAPEDCTGCGVCVEICPAKNKSEARLKAINMEPQHPIVDAERDNYDFFLNLPEVDRTTVKIGSVKGAQLLQPLFEYSGACSGCGETPYVKLLSQLFGDRLMIANATGCSSIYGGNLPTTPWAKNPEGRGPAWSNSLFEDNAEFGLGFRLSVDHLSRQARDLINDIKADVDPQLVDEVLGAEQKTETDLYEQRLRVEKIKGILQHAKGEKAKQLASIADYLVRKSVWIVGGDGWAYDIGYGGLDHVMASGRDVNILVLDTEVYSNTGGQASKATPRGAVAKFAAAGKSMGKKDLGLIAMSYGNVYVAQIAMGANDAQTVKAFMEAEAYKGPSLIIAYSQCVAHGIDMRKGFDQHTAAVACGHWPLYRYDPEAKGKRLRLDSKTPKGSFEDYAYKETRYRMLTQSMPDRGRALMKLAKSDAKNRWERYQHLAELKSNTNGEVEQ